MKILTLAVILVAALTFVVGTAMAVAPGKTQEWETSMGKVVFDGQKHKDAGLSCADCHPNIFKMKGGSFDATLDDHNAGKDYCWACHNGTKAFESKGNCEKCHQK